MPKNLYHSALCSMGLVKVEVTSDVLKSKFKKDGKDSYYVNVKIDGVEYSYTIENEDCKGFFKGTKGRAFTLTAEGSRAEAALNYVAEAAPEEGSEEAPPAPKGKARGTPPPKTPPERSEPRASSSPPPPPAARSTPPPAQNPPQNDESPGNDPEPASPPPPPKPKPPVETPAQKIVRAKLQANRIANLALVAYAGADFYRNCVRQQFGKEVSDSHFESVLMNIQIQLEKDGFDHLMPTGILEVGPGEQHQPKTETAAQ